MSAKNETPVAIPLGSVTLRGDLAVPSKPRGLVLFSHGSGSSRHSPRNRFVAGWLRREGFATLLMDLLTENEDLIYQKRFDIALLTKRLLEVTRWALDQPQLSGLPATSEPAPGPPRPCSRLPSWATASPRSSPAAAGPTSPWRPCPR